MGVPAFFRWLSKKYPSIVVHSVEEKVRILGLIYCSENALEKVRVGYFFSVAQILDLPFMYYIYIYKDCLQIVMADLIST